MATIAARLQAEIDRANAVTGKGDTTVHNAVGSLIEGFGQSPGGSDGWIGDGNTHIWIHLEEGRTSPMLGCCPQGTVTVDWGDGTEPDTLTGASTSTVVWTPIHNYANHGDYVITLTTNGEVGFRGGYGLLAGAYTLRYSSGEDQRNKVYRNAVRKIEIGNNVTFIGSYAFSYYSFLTLIKISNGVTSIRYSAFTGCTKLDIAVSDGNQSFAAKDNILYSKDMSRIIAVSGKFLGDITLPNSVISIAGSAFEGCTGLTSVAMGSGVTSIGSSAFSGCDGLTNVTIPDSVTSIGNYAFYNCYGVHFFDFTNYTSVPTLQGSYAFRNISADCEIRVPAALYEEWKAATNWATYADHIVGVGIPPEYQQVEFIESTGTQYIDPEYRVKSNYVEIHSKIFTNVTGVEMAVFGSGQTLEAGFSSTRDRMFAYDSRSKKSCGGTFSNIYNSIIDFGLKLSPTGRTVSVNEEHVSDEVNHNLTDEKILLCSYYGTGYRFKGRIYGFKLYDNSDLVRDLVPCYRQSDQVIGMYDLITKTFYTNKGTGDFTVGADAEATAEEALAELQEVQE